MKRIILLGIAILVICCTGAALAGEAKLAEKGTGITVIPATEWENQFPDVYASYMANGENEAVIEYTEEYPIIQTIYEGYGFAKYYGSARGHYYCVSDLMATGRPHALANCFTCKTAEFTVMTLNDGDSAYSLPFESVDPAGLEDVGCFTCHANEPGVQITITHTYLADAVGEDFASIPQADLSCGQCHVEYYFAPEGKNTAMPATRLAELNPDAMYDFYEKMGFSDYTNPRTGVNMLKAQHPEFETVLGKGSVHGSTFTCADCHMAKETNDKGETYRSHYLVSPLASETIQANCAACHSDLAGFVHGVQEKIVRRTVAIGENLKALTDRLADAVASGKYTDEQLATCRALNRKGQWYWDFVFVENSNGAHNSRLSTRCLDMAEAFIDAAMLQLDKLEKSDI
jgi:nitrite reductase (cytochrome c-552)